MPVSVDDPFLLASFSSTTHHRQQQQAVSCTPEERNTELAQDEDQSNLLVVAIQGEGVQLYNTADQKCILSYSTPPGYSFAGSAQTHHKSAQLRNVYAVIAKGTDIPAKEEGKVVWMWRDESSASSSLVGSDSAMAEDTVKPSTARKTVHKFDRKIHQLFVSPILPDHVLFTNTDGSISLVTEDLKRVVNTKDFQTAPALKSSKKEKKEAAMQEKSGNTVWATTYNTSYSWIPASALARNTLIVMTVVEVAAGKSIATLSYVNEEQRGFTTLGQVEIQAAAGASGFAFDAISGQLSFMTADGHLKIFNFELSQGDHIVSATESLTLPLPGYATSAATPATKPTKKGSKVATEIGSKVHRVDTVALGDNYLAVAGIHQNNGKAEQTLTIWDIRYGTLQAKHVIPGSSTVHNTTCQLALLPGSVLVMTISTLLNTTIKSDIYLCHFYAEPMSLLGAMGRMRDTAPFLGQNGQLIAQDAYTSTMTVLLTPANMAGVVKASELTVEGTDLEKQVEASQRVENEVLESLSSESKTSTVETFEKIFFEHVERKSAEAEKDLMKKFGVDAEEAKTAVKEMEEKRTVAHKQLQQQQHKLKKKDTQDMDVDMESVIKAADPTVNKKKKKKAAKVAAKKAEKESQAAKDLSDGASSDSSSDDEDDVVDLVSEDEADEDEEKDEEDGEEEQEYVVNEEEEQARKEAYLKAVEEWRMTEAEAIKSYKAQRRLLRAGRKQVPPPELSHHFVTTVVGRCFSQLSNGQPDLDFWPAKVIEYLIKNQLVGNSNPGAGQSGIALDLMERQQWSLLELALTKFYDIPEMDMIMMLKQVIGLNKNKTTASTQPSESSSAPASASSKKSKAASSTSSASAISVPDIPHFLNLIMAAPRNEVFMHQAFKRLSVEEISIVLEVLKGWIIIWDERGGIGHQNQLPDRKQLPGGLPGYGLIIEFTTMILDVHFPSLILSPHLHPLLKEIQQSIQRETDVSNQLEQALRGPLGLFNRKHREMMQRKKATTTVTGAANGGGTADKRRRRRWEGGEGIPDYAVEVIHL
ncbi:hypothetical protein BG011_000124 [Mortierella polycephala]|uniref:Uncharacterized protein n=1 Tax=Mortierella polycephala TaxID=41804 RepID=A0A9P6Q7N2_9FUNG|nr:hypothetical protein BG011_000124 [Mortierella polycephala]